MAVVSEHNDLGIRRELADVVEVMLGHRDSGPEPMEKDGHVKRAVVQNGFELPRLLRVNAQRMKPFGVATENLDAELLERRLITVAVRAASPDVGNFVSSSAETPDDLHDAHV